MMEYSVLAPLRPLVLLQLCVEVIVIVGMPQFLIEFLIEHFVDLRPQLSA